MQTILDQSVFSSSRPLYCHSFSGLQSDPESLESPKIESLESLEIFGTLRPPDGQAYYILDEILISGELQVKQGLYMGRFRIGVERR